MQTKPKYEVGQSVYAIIQNALQEIEVQGIHTTYKDANTNYPAKFSYSFEKDSTVPRYTHTWIPEERIFATKAEYIESL